MSDWPDEEPAVPKPRRKRWLVAGLLLVVSLLGLPLGSYLFWRWQLARELEAALAEARAVEPLLTIAELEAAREAIPVEENSARVIIEASQHIPASLPFDKQTERVNKLAPNEPLDDEARAALKATLKQTAPALEKLRGLEDLRRGRHAIQWQPDVISTRMDHAMSTRRVCALLLYQARQFAEQGQPDEGLRVCRAALAAGRALHDEPLLLSQLFRSACLGQVVEALERVLARSEPSEAALLAMQQAWQDEDQVPIMLIALRGERAFNHAVCEAVASGMLPVMGLLDGLATPTGVQEHIEELAGRHLIEQAHPYCLRYLTGLVRIASLPIHTRKAASEQLKADLGPPPRMALALVNPIDKILEGSAARSPRWPVAPLPPHRGRRADLLDWTGRE